MTRIAWPQLLSAALRELRMSPDEFWRLTPAELICICGGTGATGAAMNRSGFDALFARFPDAGDERELDDRS